MEETEIDAAVTRLSMGKGKTLMEKFTLCNGRLTRRRMGPVAMEPLKRWEICSSTPAITKSFVAPRN